MEERDDRRDDRSGSEDAAGVDSSVDRARFQRHLERGVFYPYPGPPDAFEIAQAHRSRGLEVTDVRFPSLLPSGFPETDTVTARLFRSSRRHDGQPVVLLHGLGLPRLAGWNSFAAALASRGFPTLLVGLPHLCERTPRGRRRGHAYTSTEAATALPAYEQAVADVRASLDWLLAFLGEGGPRGSARPAVVGVSLGAFVALIAAAMEPRFGSLVSILGGADLDTVVFEGTYRMLVQPQLDEAGIRLENRRRARVAYGEYLGEVRRAEHPLDVEAPFHFFLFDPLTFARHLRTTPALLINARFDPIIPRNAVRQLWLELGKPEVSWLWGTHWAGGPWRPFVINRVARFLRGPGASGSREPADSAAVLWPI